MPGDPARPSLPPASPRALASVLLVVAGVALIALFWIERSPDNLTSEVVVTTVQRTVAASPAARPGKETVTTTTATTREGPESPEVVNPALAEGPATEVLVLLLASGVGLVVLGAVLPFATKFGLGNVLSAELVDRAKETATQAEKLELEVKRLGQDVHDRDVEIEVLERLLFQTGGD